MTTALAPTPCLAGRTVLVRTSFDNGIDPTLAPVVRALAEAGARVAVIAGYGEAAGEFNPALSLRRFVPALAAAIGGPVVFVGESVGTGAEAALARVPPGGVALLENLRFTSDDRRATPTFAMRLSVLADHFVVTGPLPRQPAPWMVELRRLLPEPPALPATPNKKAS